MISKFKNSAGQMEHWALQVIGKGRDRIGKPRQERDLMRRAKEPSL